LLYDLSGSCKWH